MLLRQSPFTAVCEQSRSFVCRQHDVCLLTLDLALPERHQDLANNDSPLSRHAFASEMEVNATCKSLAEHSNIAVVIGNQDHDASFPNSVISVALDLCASASGGFQLVRGQDHWLWFTAACTLAQSWDWHCRPTWCPGYNGRQSSMSLALSASSGF